MTAVDAATDAPATDGDGVPGRATATGEGSGGAGRWARWEGWVDATVDPRPLAATRILAGLASLVWLYQFSHRFGPGFDPDRLHITWPVVGHHLEGLPPLVPQVLVAAGAIVLLADIGARIGAAAVVLGVGAFFLVDRQHYGNATYFLLLVCGLLVLADSGAARSPVGPVLRRAPWWPTLLLAAQLSITYLYAAVQKFRPASLRGDTISWQLRGPVSNHLAWSHLAQVLNLAAGLTEVAVALALWFPRTRRLALVAGIALHLGVLLFVRWDSDMLAFGLASLALYPAFWVVGEPQLPTEA